MKPEDYKPSDLAKNCTNTAHKMGDILYKDAEENDGFRMRYVSFALSCLISHDMRLRAKSTDRDIKELYAKFLEDLNKYFELFVLTTGEYTGEN